MDGWILLILTIDCRQIGGPVKCTDGSNDGSTVGITWQNDNYSLVRLAKKMDWRWWMGAQENFLNCPPLIKYTHSGWSDPEKRVLSVKSGGAHFHPNTSESFYFHTATGCGKSGTRLSRASLKVKHHIACFELINCFRSALVTARWQHSCWLVLAAWSLRVATTALILTVAMES